MTTIRFRSPSGEGVATAEVLQRSGIEFVEVEVSLFREMMSDLNFTEEHPEPPDPDGMSPE